MRSLLFFFLFVSSFAMGQEVWTEKPLASFQIPQLDLVSFDTKDQVFISSLNGDIFQFDENGIRKNYFSPPRQGKLNQLEANWTVNIFSFSSDLQSFRIMDRFLNPISEGDFFGSEVNLAKAASLGNNNILWVWDESDLSLKRLDYLRKLTLDSQPLNLILKTDLVNVQEIREFKNLLFMNIPDSGIYIFDNQGNFIKKLNIQNSGRLCFFQRHLYWIEEDTLWKISIDTDKKSPLYKLKENTWTELQIGQEKLALYGSKLIEIYQLPEKIKTLK